MDNALELASYKHYLDPLSGERPAVFVTFLNIVPDPGARVNGALLAVEPDELAVLDSRERSYDRVDVSELIDPAPQGRVWSYVGRADAVARFERAVSAQRAVIDSNYLGRVRDHFARLGADALAEYDALTDPLPCAVQDLERVDH
jgi:Gamma-glutamyl cyclotransferase, AIG2-like